ncbi:MAG TPA: 4-hydroxy-tetrahydrodipicolinate synthase [Elusimicrobia bacterium]|nr:MAG: 4-hydroxy-tetrahydrodipicolinate synthase [Elusimicrobia bacterium GWA2_66_18]OGR73669.1 MAG: 4-hydroxy-tetrahydrodipicolinate synthase [Elusimicrobia bacterium GWC2_65_9]HAZ07708.1 4-hydroxy-tetrahydrodipicolinate synthase [Elusimicrobiota bacterium]
MKFEGSYVALVTPFDSEGRLDEDAYRDLVRRQIKSGIRGLVPCGSTGEAATLLHEEHRRCLELCMEESRGETPVMAGVGANATWKAVELSREAESLGVDALLVLAPYYNKPTQEGLYQHFRAVARETRLPVMVYNIPGRCAVNISPKTIARLAKSCPNVIAVKEAAGSLDQVSEILTLAPKDFVVMSGDDSLTLPMMAVGARGVVSVVANVAPKQTQALCDAFLKGDLKKARALHLQLFPLVKALFIETNPIPVKAALGMMGLCRPEPRLPLTPLSEAARPALRRALKNFGLL